METTPDSSGGGAIGLGLETYGGGDDARGGGELELGTTPDSAGGGTTGVGSETYGAREDVWEGEAEIGTAYASTTGTLLAGDGAA